MIRPATPDDVPAIVALERACPAAAHWNESEYRLVFDPEATPRILLVAVDPDVIGFIVVRALGPEWEIENVAVASGGRRQGVGSQLVAAAIDEARNCGAESIFLEVRASNVAARALYMKAGFSELGHRRGYYSTPEEDAILYRFRVAAASQIAP